MPTVTAVDASDPKITTDPNSPLYVDLSTDSGNFDVTVKGSDGGDTVILGDFEGKVKTGDGGDLIDVSGGGSSTVTGGGGNDYIVSGGDGSGSATGAVAASGGSGNTFIFKEGKDGSGKDVIEGFDLDKDVIKIRGYEKIDSAKDVIKHAKQDGDNVVIKLGDGNKITLLNVDLKDLKKNPGDHFDVS